MCHVLGANWILFARCRRYIGLYIHIYGMYIYTHIQYTYVGYHHHTGLYYIISARHQSATTNVISRGCQPHDAQYMPREWLHESPREVYCAPRFGTWRALRCRRCEARGAAAVAAAEGPALVCDTRPAPCQPGGRAAIALPVRHSRHDVDQNCRF